MNNIKYYRELAGLSLAELAERSGISEKKLYDFENDYRTFEKSRVSVAVVLSRVLGCTVEQLAGNRQQEVIDR